MANTLATVYTVTGFKGGTGKSMTSVHLAEYLHRRAPTALVDGDERNQSATRWAKRAKPPYAVLPLSEQGRAVREYKYVVVDTQGNIEEPDLFSLAKISTKLLIPTSPDRWDLDALVPMVGALQRVGKEKYCILLTKVPPRPSRDGEDARALLIKLGLPVLDGQITFVRSFPRAIDQGLLIYQMKDPRAVRGWDEYSTIFEEFIQ